MTKILKRVINNDLIIIIIIIFALYCTSELYARLYIILRLYMVHDSGQLIKDPRYKCSLIILVHKQQTRSFVPIFHTLHCVAKSMKCLSSFTPAEAQVRNQMMLIAVISLALGEWLRCCLDMDIHSETF